MGAERVDYYSDDEYQQALQAEAEQERKWAEEQQAEREAEERMIADATEREHGASDCDSGGDKRDPVHSADVIANAEAQRPAVAGTLPPLVGHSESGAE